MFYRFISKKLTTKNVFILIFGLLVVSLIYLSYFLPLTQDEGVFLTISNGLLNGKSPYKDFFDHKTPGIYFLLTPIIDLFGKNIFALKLFLILNNLISAILVFFISEKIKKGSGIFSSLLFLFTSVFFQGNRLITEPFMITFILGSIYFYLNSNKNNRYLLFSGITAGIAVLLKQTAIINFLILTYFMHRDNKEMLKEYFIGFLTPWGLTLLYLIKVNSLNEAINQSVSLNITNYPREPLSLVLKKLSGTFKQTLPLWLLFGFYLPKIRNHKKDQLMKFLYASIFIPIPFLLFRHYPHYWLQIIPFVAIMAGITLANLFTIKNTFIKYLSISLIFLSFFLNYKWFSWGAVNQDGPKLKEQVEVNEYINRLPQKTILTENQFTGYYFLSSKEPLTKYLFLSEITEQEKAEKKTISALERSSDTLILWPKNNEFAYAKDLQGYIIKNYRVSKEFNKQGLLIYEKK